MGFLDTLLGDANQTQALGLLGVNMMQGRTANGFAQAQGLLAGVPDRELKRKMLEAQIAETMAQAEERKMKPILAQRAAETRQRTLYGDPNGLSPGAFQLAADGSGPALPQGSAPQAGGLIGYARSLGIPEQQIMADIDFNGGKKLSEIIGSRTAPKWENINGNLVNVNAPGFQGGFQPGMSVSSDGKGVAWQPDGNGGVVMGAPRGALETYGAYKGMDAVLGAAGRVNLRPNADGTQSPVSELTENPTLQRLVGGAVPPQIARPPQPQVRPNALIQPGDADRERIFASELQAAQGRLKMAATPVERQRAQNDIDGLTREMQRNGIAAPAGVGYGKTTAQEIAEAAAKESAVGQVKADVVSTKAKESAFQAANSMISVLDKALDHPGLPEATGLQGMIDPRNYIPGTDAKNFNVLMQQLKGKTFLTAFESLKGGGTITEVEGLKAENAIARLSQAQSTDEFKSALGDLREIVLAQNPRLSGRADDAQAPPARKAAALPANPTASSLIKGQAYTLPNGKTGVWDGFRFKVTP